MKNFVKAIGFYFSLPGKLCYLSFRRPNRYTGKSSKNYYPQLKEILSVMLKSYIFRRLKQARKEIMIIG